MAQKIPRQDLIEIVKRFPQGASTEEIMLAMTLIPRRTLQRWLARLIQEGRIEAVGAARARRYRLIPQAPRPFLRPHESFPLSDRALEIHAMCDF